SATVTFGEYAGLSVRDIIEIVGLALATLGGIVGVATYFRDVRQKQTDWLYQLFDKFYEKATYKRMRALLDCGPDGSADLHALARTLSSPDNSADEEAFVDYMNFFEFVVGLRDRRRMSRKDVEAMFDYYLNCLAKHCFARDYAANNGFEALDQELKRRHIK